MGMKIGELQEHCGNCQIIDFCTEPYETPKLCACEELSDVEQEEYKQIAESIAEHEIEDKLWQYRENNVSPWDDERKGAICDIVLNRIKGCYRMTENGYLELPWSVEDTIENLKEIKEMMIAKVKEVNLDGKAESDAKEIEFDYDRAITAIEEIQQYRALGTVEDFKNKINNVDTLSRMYEELNDKEVKEYRELKAYKDIGTVEELREAMEKQRAKKQGNIDDSESHFRLSKSGFLCCCVTNKDIRYPLIDLRDLDYCPRCGQAIDWSEEDL